MNLHTLIRKIKKNINNGEVKVIAFIGMDIISSIDVISETSCMELFCDHLGYDIDCEDDSMCDDIIAGTAISGVTLPDGTNEVLIFQSEETDYNITDILEKFEDNAMIVTLDPGTGEYTMEFYDEWYD